MSYVELHCQSNFSFLEGASHADELVERAAALGYGGLAVTDRNTLAGVVRAHGAAKDRGLPLVIGAELHPQDGLPVVVWAADRRGYGRLARLLTTGRRRAVKGECWLRVADIAEHAEGLLAGVVPERGAARDGEGGARESSEEQVEPAPLVSDAPEALADASAMAVYREIFGDRAYLLAERFLGVDDERRWGELRRRSRQARLPLVAAGGVRYHSPARLPLADVLAAIRHGTTVERLGARRFANAQRHLRGLDEIAERFAAAPDAVRRTLEIRERCRFSLDELRYEYPEELAPAGQTTSEYLTRLTWAGAAVRYPRGVPEKVRRLVEHELALIAELRYEAYFLTVWDLVRFARERGILCQGRGSAANSAVCYCLGVTSVDPERSDVLFERFVSRERNEAPDIDVDFEHERREEVLQYLYDKYGRERAGMTAVVITYGSRSAIRDVGKTLGLSLDRVDALAKQVEGYRREEKLAERCVEAGLDPASPTGLRFRHLVEELIGFPRHLSQHVGGMVMTRGPLCELAPIENAAMPGRTVIQWNKDDLDELGILKVDCLALGMLTAIRKCFALVERHQGERYGGERLTLATVPAEDARTYDMICEADTMGVFQIESRAQMSMLPRLRPREFYDLVIEVAIVRPGPIQGQMVHPYLRRRAGEETPAYPSEAIREVLHKTLGVPLFQEQAMRLAVVAAGFTPGEADQLRRAMGAWRRPGIIDQFRLKLLAGMESRGLSRQFAEQVFQQIRGFGEYGFPESHAASFALLVYVSAWLKRHHPAAFVAALLNSQPMGFYAPAQLIRDARRHGVTVRPIDVNASDWDCTLEAGPGDEPALRLGFRLLHGVPRAAVERLVGVRGARPFQSWEEFARRADLSAAVLEKLADADVFGSLRLDRRQALWQSLAVDRTLGGRPLLRGLADESGDEGLRAGLPPLSLVEQVFADYRTAGLSLKAHPLSFVRRQLDRLRVTPAERLERAPVERHLRVAGLVLLRQRPSTAKGITFVTLEDETGVINLVVKQGVWDANYQVARRSPAWIAHGKLERRDSVIHVVVNRLEDLAARVQDVDAGKTYSPMARQARDFR